MANISKPTLSLAMLVIASIFITESLGQEETLCRGTALNMTPEQKTVMSDCLTEAGIASVWEIPPAKLACLGVCILSKKGLLTADGKIDHGAMVKYIDQVMRPEAVKQPLKDGVEKCYKAHGDKVAAKDDPTCSGFADVGMCLHEVFLKECVPT